MFALSPGLPISSCRVLCVKRSLDISQIAETRDREVQSASETAIINCPAFVDLRIEDSVCEERCKLGSMRNRSRTTFFSENLIIRSAPLLAVLSLVLVLSITMFTRSEAEESNNVLLEILLPGRTLVERLQKLPQVEVMLRSGMKGLIWFHGGTNRPDPQFYAYLSTWEKVHQRLQDKDEKKYLPYDVYALDCSVQSELCKEYGIVDVPAILWRHDRSYILPRKPFLLEEVSENYVMGFMECTECEFVDDRNRLIQHYIEEGGHPYEPFLDMAPFCKKYKIYEYGGYRLKCPRRPWK